MAQEGRFRAALLESAPYKAWGDNPGVRLVDRGFLDLAVFADADLAEEDLVQEPAAKVAGCQIGLQRLLGELKRIIEGFLDIG